MMIDLQSEKLIALADVPELAWLPKRRGGTKLNVTTVHRWCGRGCRGVKLEVWSVGGSRCTTESALLRFFERLAGRAGRPDAPTPSQRTKAQQRAKAALDAAGF